ncbi:MAG: Ig-like domain-containing protein, partial [Planctomycetaceae bacterium]|nr:Ig-like domain-containing protein [Planctomycetaceae bacterium]
DSPIVLGQLDLAGDATDVAVDGSQNVAVLAANAGGVHVVDVSDPMLPSLLTTWDVSASQVELFEGVAYLAEGTSIVAVELASSDILQELNLGSATITGLARHGNFLYTMDASRNLRVIDVANTFLQQRGAVQVPHGAGKLFVGETVAYAMADSYFRRGFSTIDISNPDSPTVISGSDVVSPFIAPDQFVVPNGSGRGLVIGTAGAQGVADLIDLSDPTETNIAEGEFLTRFNLPSQPFSAAIGGGLAFIAGGTGGLQVVNYLPFDNQGQAPVITATFDDLDIDSQTTGIQVVEGSTFTVPVSVMDDVQVRNVELLVNGQVVQNDVSFPFDLLASVPLLADGSNTATLEVRATDTGGNTISTNPVTVEILPDSTPPSVITISPGQDSSRFEGHQTIRVRFSEAMDPQSLTAANIALTAASNPGIPLVPTDVQVRFGGREVQLLFPPLALDDYTITLDASMLTDLAGNPIGGANVTSMFSIIENRDPGDTIATALDLGVLNDPFFTVDEELGVSGDTADIY